MIYRKEQLQMSKVLDLNKNLYTLCNEYPEIKDIMASLGFSEITKPAALNTMGKIMTIPKGAGARGVPIENIIKAFRDAGFTVENIPE